MAAPPIYGLRLAAVRVQDFKSLHDVVVTFSSGTTVLVGENNSGKTSLLEALDVAFGRRYARLEDLYDGPKGRATTFTIDLRIDTIDGGDFPQGVIDVVGDAIQLADPDFFTIRIVGTVSAEGWEITLSRTFIKGWAENRTEGASLPLIDSPRVGREALALLHYDMLDARRDIVEQLRNRRTYWGRTTSKISIPDAVKKELEASLDALGKEVTNKSSVLSQVRDDLASLADGLSTGNLRVELETLPRSVDDLMRAMDIVITSTESASFSVESHGMGTRSLAALLVFRSYVNVIRPRQNPERLLSVAAFEEPEAHLHPQAQRAVFDILSQIGGQRIVSTHSAHVASIAGIDAYRVFRRHGSETRVSSVLGKAVKNWSLEHVRRYVQTDNPEVLFAKAVGIVEGETEAGAFPVFAKSWWGLRGADGRGVSLVYTAGAGNSKHIVPFLDALSIPWVIFCDGDEAGRDGLKATAEMLGRTLTDKSPEVIQLPNGEQFEEYILKAGFLNEACLAADRHPEGTLTDYMRRNQGNKRKDGTSRDYSGVDGRSDGCLDFLRRYKGTVGAFLAEEIVRPVGGTPRYPPLVEKFFVSLDKAKS